jgi:hypothetical protein
LPTGRDSPVRNASLTLVVAHMLIVAPALAAARVSMASVFVVVVTVVLREPKGQRKVYGHGVSRQRTRQSVENLPYPFGKSFTPPSDVPKYPSVWRRRETA